MSSIVKENAPQPVVTDVPAQTFDYVLVGGGLQSGLIALALRHYQPNASVLIVESGDQLAGNHTWSFHNTDLSDEMSAWIEGVVEHRWPNYEVRVGGSMRRVDIGYCSVSSRYFAKRIHDLVDESQATFGVLLNSQVIRVAEQSVKLADGRVLQARCVIDNRGPRQLGSAVEPECSFPGGFQKFWGFELRLPVDWPLSRPVIMDDRVDQADGFRFLYTLPFELRRVLVEDTRFSNSRTLSRDECLHEVDGYLRNVTEGQVGIADCEIVREESGVLPMPYAGFYPSSGSEVIAGGYRGGWFHAATGYSFPMALRFAEWVATTPIAELRGRIANEARQQVTRARFARFLNRLLFELVKPASRYQIFRRFYRVLQEPRIARFYSHRFTAMDAARIVIGIPPTGLQPVRFMRSFWNDSTWLEANDSSLTASSQANFVEVR